MRRLLAELFARKIASGAVLLESLVFVVVYLAALLAISPGTPARTLVENIGVLTASGAGALWILRSLPDLPIAARRAWLALGIAQLAWFVGDFLKGYVGSLIPGVPFVSVAASGVHLVAYLLAGCALLLFPFYSQHAPTRFRFILDAVISAGAVVALGFLVLVRPLSQSYPRLAPLVPIGYPLGDCILLTILANFALANWVPRRTAAFLASAWLTLLASDYVRTSLLLIGNYQAGSMVGTGWIVAPLLLGCGSIYERRPSADDPHEGASAPGLDIGVQFQRVLPIALELVLVWYVLADWRLRGEFSAYGLWTSIVLGVMLVVRLGIRAGEAELDQYWRLFNNLADPSFVADNRGRVLLSNPAYEEVSGFTIRGRPGQASLVELFEGISMQILAQAALADQTIAATLKGRGTPYLLTLSPIAGNRHRTRIAGVAHNLTEQRRQRDAIQSAYDELSAVHHRLEDLNAQLERRVQERTQTLQDAYNQLEQQNRVLQSLDQMKTDFVSMVSHELRAPLTNLGGGLELLLRRNHSGDDIQTLTSIQEEIHRLTRFVETILNVSAMEAGKLVLHLVPLSLPAVAYSSRSSWSSMPEIDRLEINMDQDLPLVMADEGALQSVFRHLLDNALKYAPDGPVLIEARPQQHRVRVEVRDFGPGVPEGKRPLLFQRFQRMEARDSQAVYGYGLGLYISQGLLRAMGGRLLFEAPADGGARFAFDLEAAE